MIHAEQKATIVKYLLSKKLPIDLVLEFQDHIMNQIENAEETNFEKAFDSVKKTWEYEFQMVFSIQAGLKYITRLERRIVNRITSEFCKKAMLLFIIIFVTSIGLLFSNQPLAYYLFLFIYTFIAVITVYCSVRFFKIWDSASIREHRKISVYQRGTLLFFSGGIFVIICNLMRFETMFEELNTTVAKMVKFSTFSFHDLLIFLHTYVYTLAWLLGLFYFLKYKNIIKKLRRQIHLKL